MNKRISLLIPAFNSEKKISNIFKKLRFNSDSYDEIIIVNDGSTDNTKTKLIEKLKDINKKTQLISHKRNYGYGGAQKTLFKYFLKRTGDIAVLIHADGQYPIEKIGEIVKPIQKNTADIVLGSRFRGKAKKGNMPVIKFIGNRILTFIENLVLGSKLSEFHTGFRAYSRKVLESIDFDKYSNYYDFDSQILFDCFSKGFQIKEIPIKSRYGDEISYLNPVKYGVKILAIIINHLIKRKSDF